VPHWSRLAECHWRCYKCAALAKGLLPHRSTAPHYKTHNRCACWNVGVGHTCRVSGAAEQSEVRPSGGVHVLTVRRTVRKGAPRLHDVARLPRSCLPLPQVRLFTSWSSLSHYQPAFSLFPSFPLFSSLFHRVPSSTRSSLLPTMFTVYFLLTPHLPLLPHLQPLPLYGKNRHAAAAARSAAQNSTGPATKASEHARLPRSPFWNPAAKYATSGGPR